MPLGAILFDLDNTLILEDASTHRALHTAARLAAERTGVDAEVLADAAASRAAELWPRSPAAEFAERFGIWWGEALWGSFAGERAELGTIRSFVPEFRRAVWRDALAPFIRAEDALADSLALAYIRDRRSAETIDPEALPLLSLLGANQRLGLVTNGAPDVQREKLSRTTFASRFATIAISVEVGFGKPDPRLFARAASDLGVAASDCAVVGDSLRRDVVGAKAAGMRAVWLDRGMHESDDSMGDAPDTAADARIERLSDLPAALDALARRPVSPRATS